MKRLVLFLLLISTPAYANISNQLNFEEADGSPSTFPYKLLVSNGTLTDNGDGTSTLTTGGGAGSPGTPLNSVQFNDASSFAGDTSIIWNKTQNRLSISRDVGQTGYAFTISSDATTTPLANISHDGTAHFQSIELSNPLSSDAGGTGLSTFTKGDLLTYSSGKILSKLAVGSNGTHLSADSSQTTGLKWVSVNQYKTFINFPVQSAKLSSDAAVRIDSGVGGTTPYTMWRLLYSDGGNNQGSDVAMWQGRMDDNWDGSPLTAKIDYLMISSDSTSTSNGGILWGVSIWAITSGDAASMTTESYATENQKGQLVPTTMSRDETCSIPISNLSDDGIAAGDWFMVKLRRQGNDVITGDAAVVSFAITQ